MTEQEIVLAHLSGYSKLMEEAAKVIAAIPPAMFDALGIRHYLCDELEGSAMMARDDAATLMTRSNAEIRGGAAVPLD